MLESILNMNRSRFDLLDLPNEILFYILDKLDNVDVLYSLFDINNERLESIIREKKFSNILNLTSITDNNTIIDRFCNSILPRIHNNVKYLIVEPRSMERILLATDYPNLTELKFFNFKRDNALHYFTDDSSIGYILKKQIQKLHLINVDHERAVGLWSEYTKTVYAHILCYFEKLEYLNVIETSLGAYPGLSLRYLPSNTFYSSILTYLNITVINFIDCLYLLDGRLKQLSIFIVQIHSIDTDSSIVHNVDDLPNLKFFSLISYCLIEEYDNKIVSLLHRMLYLEKLTLYLRIAHQRVFIDPIYLLNQFTMHLSQLYSFKFYLSTINDKNNFVNYLSNNNIKQSNINIEYQPISNIVFFNNNTATYHVFTLPFEFVKLMSIGNIFPNILFNNVIELWVYDIIPLEHQFFLRISKAFPLLKNFIVSDFESSLNNVLNSSDNIESYDIVKYPHLTSLDLTGAGVSCIDQFLNQNKTYLPCLTQLRVRYEDLRITTEDFTREATRRNCANVTRLITGRQIVGSKDYYTYFPLL